MVKKLLEFLGRDRKQIAAMAEESVANGHRLNHLSWQVDQLQREMRLLLGALSLPPHQIWRGKPDPIEGRRAENAFPFSTLCRQESFEAAYFPYWTRKVGAALIFHRKIWEYVFICQALWERGAIQPGARALGFGVGREPLTAFFASQDCDIVATDMAPDLAVDHGWSQTEQHAAGAGALRYEHVCPGEQFDRRVAFQVCDMNAVPAELIEFDFVWSACALEHLGSIENGLRFIERSIDCLKPGGWAVHTTEFNVGSDGPTVDDASTVLFRRSDMEELVSRLAAKGHTVAPFDFDPGLKRLDQYIDVPPYRMEPHLKLAIQGYASTSIGIIVQRGP